MKKLTNIEKILKAKKDNRWPANTAIIEISQDRWLLTSHSQDGLWSIWLFEPSGYWNKLIAKNLTTEEVVKIWTKIILQIHNH